MINISNPKSNPKPDMAFFEFAFRPFFLLASLFSIFSLLVWNGILTGNIALNLYGGPLWWHMHEMLFAFVAAIIVGFLLTAVQNWTGVRGLHGKGLLLIVALWLTARVLFFFPNSLSHSLIAIVDIAFLPVAAIILAYPIVSVKLWRNLLFIPILLIMAATNAMMHYSIISQNLQLMGTASSAMILLVTLMMCIMGGRVFPMFTANGTKTARVMSIAWLEKLVIGSTLLAVLTSFNFIPLPSILIAVIFFVAASANALRVFRWKSWVTFKTPLVWSLHLSYWCIAIGLLMIGLSEITASVSHSQAIHTLTIGAMASMILAMISRVSLGHTGRNMVVGKVMTMAFIALILAFIMRVFGSYWVANYSHVISIAIGFWVIGYGCFVALYFPILTKPRL
ncbi:Heme/copper membrane protein of NnrS family protein [Psychromonas ingrahamii 37]|uniref:Heme/copper membrane protein of NnrS family protein n=1 Tax=Psychromonas ingrahamii (strain DSM 17664 / CCUG 51855 / 37) TaxID=357804 RepID=A1SSL8_PSYIN|nr:NnrS family protein [Psychromonas ingrahamii]ABM02483.1 Heme/copper membrane protein of NnrS family protein [Psychromonas ingrahamii 37]